MEYTKDCGCKIRTFAFSGAELIYCPKHLAAPDIYEALRLAFRDLCENGRITEPVENVIKQALAKAEGL